MVLSTLSTIGFLLFIASILCGAYLIVRYYISKQIKNIDERLNSIGEPDKYDHQKKDSIRRGQDTKRSLSNILNSMPSIPRIIPIAGVILAIGLTSIRFMFFYADAGYSYLVQYPWGKQVGVVKPGFHFRFFGETSEWKKYLSLAHSSLKKDQGAFSGVSPEQNIRFNDSVTADIRMTTRFQLPESPEQFRDLAVAFRSQQNLINASLFPIIEESMRNSGRMFAAQEYVGGKGGDFENAITDQIRNGINLLDVTQTISETGKREITQADARTIQQETTAKIVVSVRKIDGIPARKDIDEHPLKKFGIRLTQANIQNVNFHKDFQSRLLDQSKIAAEVAIQRQETRKENERKLAVIAKGEADKAEKQVELEKEQIVKVVAAETRAKEAEQDQIERITKANTLKEEAEVAQATAQIQLETDRLKAQSIETLARAQANEREWMIEADNALQMRLNAAIEIHKEYAMAISSNPTVPSVVVGGGGNGGTSPSSAMDLVSLLIAKVSKDLAVDIGTTNEK